MQQKLGFYSFLLNIKHLEVKIIPSKPFTDPIFKKIYGSPALSIVYAIQYETFIYNIYD